MHRKDVRKMVKKKKKNKLRNYILTYKRLILSSAEKNKKIPLGGPRQGS